MQAASNSPSDKAAWRRKFRSELSAHRNIDGDSAAIRRHLVTALGKMEPARIATFAALPGEADLLGLLEDLPHHQWVFPRVIGEDLVFHQVAAASDLSPATMGIMEPPAELPVAHPDSLDIVLCPGLGFGRDGSRLGRGRGYYDRTLENCQDSAMVIGIALPHQLVESVPTESHDRYMEQIVTPSEILDCRKP